MDDFERAHVQRLQRRLDDVQRRKVLGHLAAADRFEVAEAGQVAELGVRCLDVDEARDLLECGEHLQLARAHRLVARSKREIVIDLLEAGERVIQDGDVAFDDGAVAEALDVARVDDVHSLTRLGTGSVARHALAFEGLCRRHKDTTTR